MYEVVIGLAGTRAMVRVSLGQDQCHNVHYAHCLYIKYILPAGPMSIAETEVRRSLLLDIPQAQHVHRFYGS